MPPFLKASAAFRAALCLALLALSTALPSALRAADANEAMREAMKYYEKGEYDRALKQFVKVLRTDPNNAQAREYMLRCSQKIVESRLGSQASETLEREISVEKQVQQAAPQAPSPLFEDAPGAAAPETAAPAQAAPSPIDQLDLRGAGVQPVNARDILQQRGALAEEIRRRYLGKGQIIQLEEDGGILRVSFYLNRLFLPFSDVLRQDSYPLLDELRGVIRAGPKRKVELNAVDNISPAVRHTMADLASRRCSVVFSYVIDAAFADGGRISQ